MTDLRQFLGHAHQAIAFAQLAGAPGRHDLVAPAPFDIAQRNHHFLRLASDRVEHHPVAGFDP